MSTNPFAPSSAGEPPISDGPSLLPVALVAVPVTIGIGVLEALCVPLVTEVPPLPLPTAIAALGLALFGAIAASLSTSRAALWPACLALPVALWAIDLSAQRGMGPVAASLDSMAFRAVWVSTLGGLVSAAWLRVPVRRWPGFLAAVGLKAQALLVGWQMLIPGLTLFVALPLLEVVAARNGPGSWWIGAMREMARSPAAWGIAIGGQILAMGLSLAVPFAWGWEVGVASFMGPAVPSLGILLATGVPAALVGGASLTLAARRVAAADAW